MRRPRTESHRLARGAVVATRAWPTRWVVALTLAGVPCTTIGCQAYDRDQYAKLLDVDTSVGSDAVIDDRSQPDAIDASASDSVETDAPAAQLDADRGDAGDTATDAPRDVPSDVPSDVPCVVHVVINEVSVRGVEGGEDEFVELANTGTCTASLEGFVLRIHTATSTTTADIWTGRAAHSIAPGGHFVIGGVDFMGAADAAFDRNYEGGTSSLPSGGGGLGLFDPAGTLADGLAVDLASSTLGEGDPFPTAPAVGESIGRVPDGVDTGNNRGGFRTIIAPSPGAAN